MASLNDFRRRKISANSLFADVRKSGISDVSSAPKAETLGHGMKLDQIIDQHIQSISTVSPTVEIPAIPPFPRTNSNENLITSMASRLSHLERSRQEQRLKLVEMEKSLLRLEAENSRLRSSTSTDERCIELEDDNRRLMKENQEMKQFLNDYGLSWVGPMGSQDSNFSIASTQSKQLADHASLPRQQVQPGEDGQQFLNLNLVEFIEGLEQLRDIAKSRYEERAGPVRKFGMIHSLGTATSSPTLPVSVFKNGILIRRGPFRSFLEQTCRDFVHDVMDGYFPSEFKNDFPHGIIFEIEDNSDKMYKGDDNKARTPVESMTKQVPKYVIKDGNILRPRESLEELLSEKSHVLPRTSSMPAPIFSSVAQISNPDLNCQLRVHVLVDGKQKDSVLLNVQRDESITVVKELLAKATGVSSSRLSRIELRTVDGICKVQDDSSVNSCGWWPRIVLYARLVSR